MATEIRPEVSKKKPYYVERHRYYELKHFCLQWKTWKRYLNDFEIRYPSLDTSGIPKDRNPAESNPTAEEVERRDYYLSLAQMVHDTAYAADEFLGLYILTAVTQGLTYESLRVNYGIPCCREHYYAAYRKFFWLLDKERK